MTRTALITSLLILCFISAIMPVKASPLLGPEYHQCSSIACARKHGAFMCIIKPVPDHFAWEGHDIQVYECWEDRADTVRYLKFKLMIDGNKFEESRIYRKSGLSIEFQHDGDGFRNAMYGIESGEFLSIGRILKYCLRLPCVEYMHDVRFYDCDNVKEIRLRVGTGASLKRSNNSYKPPVMSDTIITFKMCGDEKKDGD